MNLDPNTTKYSIKAKIKADGVVEKPDVVGAIFGLMLGWVVTRIANQVMNTVVLPADTGPLDLFYFPLWLILGAIAFSIVISLAAGLYPAIRAARIDPVRALRHD